MDRRVLTKEELQGLTPEERQFAQQQFRIIYAEQMSRVTAELSNKKKVQQKLQTLDELEQKNMKNQYDKLRNKMASIQENRNKKLEQKVKGYKNNDERWFNKLKQIQNKFRQQNRQAIQKAKKYREESQNYWKEKQKKVIDTSKTNFDISRTMKSYQDEGLHKSSIIDKGSMINHQKKFNGFGINKKMTINEKQRTQRNNTMPKIELDDQIKMHQQKSDHLQRQKQTLVFQKALQKMEKIEQNRAKVIKDKQTKISEPTKPKQVDYNHASLGKKMKNKRQVGISSALNRSGKSKGSLEKLIKDHLNIKHKLEEQQFMQRGQILENSVQKSRKDKIIKMIKNRVQQIKVNAILKENSKKSLGIGQY